ncbi:MAG: signal recognition particle-docking protein FtsY [Spirochaetales bacterium]|nr:signal recognition particle-docking protein FtsY [Spirochaetales bacterium]
MAKINFGSRLKKLFTSPKWDENMFEELEDLLIGGDLGAVTSMEISDRLKERIKKDKPGGREDIQNMLKEMLSEEILTEEIIPEKDKMNVYLILGVNGVGKTTTIAKMAKYFSAMEGITPVLSAGDTFRAAAIDQLEVHGERLGIRVVRQNPGADPGAVIFDTLESASARSENLVLADTAGRMHNKANLIKELQKIHKIVQSKTQNAIYKKLLVIDATTGQNGLRQAETFHEAVGIDGIILSKYDSAAKGGVVVPICKELKVPFCFIGTGENYESLQPFDKDYFLNTLLEI